MHGRIGREPSRIAGQWGARRRATGALQSRAARALARRARASKSERTSSCCFSCAACCSAYRAACAGVSGGAGAVPYGSAAQSTLLTHAGAGACAAPSELLSVPPSIFPGGPPVAPACGPPACSATATGCCSTVPSSEPSYSEAITSGGAGASADTFPRLPTPPNESAMLAPASRHDCEKEDVSFGLAAEEPDAADGVPVAVERDMLSLRATADFAGGDTMVVCAWLKEAVESERRSGADTARVVDAEATGGAGPGAGAGPEDCACAGAGAGCGADAGGGGGSLDLVVVAVVFLAAVFVAVFFGGGGGFDVEIVEVMDGVAAVLVDVCTCTGEGGENRREMDVS